MIHTKLMTRLVAASFVIAMTAAAAHAGTLTLPKGAELHVILETTLNTKTTKPGDPFRARLVLSVFANEQEILPVGTAVEGTVVSLKPPARVKGRAEMQLRPEKLFLPDGRDVELGATLESANTGDDTKVDSKEGTIKGGAKEGIDKRGAASGAVMGAGIGAMTGGGMGAAIGAGAVGAMILMRQILKKGKDAELPAGSELVLQTTRDVSFSDMQEVRNPATAKPKENEPFRVNRFLP